MDEAMGRTRQAMIEGALSGTIEWRSVLQPHLQARLAAFDVAASGAGLVTAAPPWPR